MNERLPDHQQTVETIAKEAAKLQRIVEIGVGWYPWIALDLKQKTSSQILVTDANPKVIAWIKRSFPQLQAIKDDVTKPKLQAYFGSQLIYAIRPPPEILPYLKKLAKKLSCPLIIRPLTNEEALNLNSEWTKLNETLFIFFPSKRN